MGGKMCEGCNDTVASFGIAGDRVKRWCASCGKAHGAVRLSARKMCEGCGYKLAHHGAAINRVKRWCASCGKEHSSGEEEAGAVEAAAGGFGLFGGGSTIFDFFFFFGIVPPSAPAALPAAAAPSPRSCAQTHPAGCRSAVDRIHIHPCSSRVRISALMDTSNRVLWPSQE
jgi:hypothetical protein